MRIGIFSPLRWIFPETKAENNSINADVVKGSYACAQFVVEECSGTIGIDTFIDGTPANPEWYRLIPVNVNRNSDFYEPLDSANRTPEALKKHFTKTAPFKVYDPMKPVSGDEIYNGKAALYCCQKIPETAIPGDYTVKIVISCAHETAEAFINLHIHNITLPAKRSLNITNWIGPNPQAYGFKWFDAKCWSVLDKIAELGRRSGQNCVSLSIRFFDVTYTDGKYLFDFSNAEKYITRLFKMGYNRIEAPHIVSVYKNMIEPYEKVGLYTDRGFECVGEFLTQWYSFLKERHWETLTLQHIGDEPKDESKGGYISLAKLAKEYMPDVPLFDAVLTSKVCSYIDIPVPITRHYQLHKTDYDKEWENAKEKWLYTCCWPTAPYLNRFLDMPLLSTRLLHWLNYKTDTVGYLHWGFCTQGNDQDVYTEPSIAFKYMGVPESNQFLPAGDTNIVYPYEGIPIGSVRLEMVRCGTEDYDLLKMLEEKNTDAAKRFTDMVLSEEWTSRVNADGFDGVYILLLKSLEEK